MSTQDNTVYNQENPSFFTFLLENYELSPFVLPKKRPENDLLSDEEMKRLQDLMDDKDFYEINTIIKSRYPSPSAS